MEKSNSIYFDYAATTPVDPRVFDTMKPYYSEKFGNPSSLHSFGQEAIAAVDKSRETIAKALGRPAAEGFREIIFTGSATEANNLALRGALKNLEFRIENLGKNASLLNPKSLPTGQAGYIQNPRIIISAIEHESVLETAKDLEREGVEVVIIPVNREGIIDLKRLEAALSENTVLVSIMHGNNEVGSVQPIAKISKIIQEYRIQNLEFSENAQRDSKNPKSSILNSISYPLFHVDASQAFQFLDCNVDKLGIDLMTLSAHKIYGPKGIGALYVKNLEFRIENLGNAKTNNTLNPQSLPTGQAGYILSPLLTGGGQEFGLRSGTENVLSIVGFAKAVELANAERVRTVMKLRDLRQYFIKGLKTINKRIIIHGSRNKSQQLPHIVNVYTPWIAEEFLMKLDMAGIAASSGSACKARSLESSRVLQAMGFTKEHAKASVRFSFGRMTTRGEIKKALSIIKKMTP